MRHCHKRATLKAALNRPTRFSEEKFRRSP